MAHSFGECHVSNLQWSKFGIIYKSENRNTSYLANTVHGATVWRAWVCLWATSPSFKAAMKADKRSGNLPATLSPKATLQRKAKARSQVWSSICGLVKEAATGFALSQMSQMRASGLDLIIRRPGFGWIKSFLLCWGLPSLRTAILNRVSRLEKRGPGNWKHLLFCNYLLTCVYIIFILVSI